MELASRKRLSDGIRPQKKCVAADIMPSEVWTISPVVYNDFFFPKLKTR
jgi:hypothetical protein